MASKVALVHRGYLNPFSLFGMEGLFGFLEQCDTSALLGYILRNRL